MAEDDDPGRPIAYQALGAGTPVYDRDGERIGTVSRVLQVEDEDVFDGLLIETDEGSRFIDAPEVGHIAEHRVDLTLGRDEVSRRPIHEYGAPVYDAAIPSSRAQDLWRRLTFRRLWRRD
jgi:sporulation protein YlmC with PRC-barrel domain